MITKRLIETTDYFNRYHAETDRLPVERHSTLEKTKRLEAMKKFKADSARLRAEIAGRRSAQTKLS